MNQRGQVYPLFAFFLIALVGFSALSVDLGYYRYQQRLQQTAADTAAISGALESLSGTDDSVTARAQADAAANGFTDGSNNVTVSVNDKYSDNYTTGANGGAVSSSGHGVKVTVTKQYGKFFGGYFKGGLQTISTSSVAVLNYSNGQPCFTGLGDAPAITTSNGVKFSAPNCGIELNGNTTCNGGSFNVASFQINSAAQNDCSGGGTSFTKASPVSSGPIPDPCSDYVGCGNVTKDLDSQDLSGDCTSATKGATITTNQSSNFTSGFKCFNNATLSGITLSAGIYLVENGIKFTGTVTGTHVLFYIMDDNAFSSKGSVVDMSTNNANVLLTAPTSTETDGGATYENVLFYQKSNISGITSIQPTCSKSSTLNCVEIKANLGPTSGCTASTATTGNWYMPHASFLLDGHSYCLTGNLMVDDATINGAGASFQMFPPPDSGGVNGLLQAFLVE